jgi:hypothetical protein
MAIPRIIHSLWLGDEPPDQIKRFTSDMRRMNEASGFTYTLHGNELIEKYASDVYVRFLQQSGEKVAFLADRIRLLILRDEGGIYIDADAKPMRPFSLLNGLWESPHVTFAYGHRNPWRPGVAIHRGEIAFVDNTFLASEPNSRMVKELLSLYTPNSKVVNGADVGKHILLRADWTCADTGIDPFYSMQDTPRTICLHDSINLGSWVDEAQKKIGTTRPWVSI